MAVIVEVPSVIIRRDAIERAFSGGWDAFLDTPAPNATACSDGDLVRFGFMALEDAQAYIAMLVAGGLTCHRDGQCVDIALVHQFSGLAWPAPWLEVGRFPIQGHPVLACWLAGKPAGNLAVPLGWNYEHSATHHPCQTGEGDDGDRRKFLRHEDGVDVYLDLLTGREVYVSRVVVRGDTPEALFTQLRELFVDALSLEGRIASLKASGDSQGAVTAFRELNDLLLPGVQRIAAGPGRGMASAHFTLGIVLRLLRRLPEAESALRKANELQPGAIQTLHWLVGCLGEQGKLAEALPLAREAVEIEPADAAAWGNLSKCLIQAGEREEARKALDHAIDLDPQNPLHLRIWDNFDRYFT